MTLEPDTQEGSVSSADLQKLVDNFEQFMGGMNPSVPRQPLMTIDKNSRIATIPIMVQE